MAAIIRLKRKWGEEHADSMFLFCKKLLTDGKCAKVESKFHFAGSTEQSEDNFAVQTVRNAIWKRKLERLHNLKCQKVEEEKTMQQRSYKDDISKRYKITGQKSAETFDTLVTSNQCLKNARFHFFDIEKSYKSVSRNKLKSFYVYDLYYMNDYKFDFSCLYNVQDIECYNYCKSNENHNVNEFFEDNDDEEEEESIWENDCSDENLWEFDDRPEFCHDYDYDDNECCYNDGDDNNEFCHYDDDY